MINNKYQLKEKMSLFWHTILCAGDNKVDNARTTAIQIDKFRDQGMGNFQDLILMLSKDPAMLYYLDNIESHKTAVNENFGRELLELFSMGVGKDGELNYTEDDVKASARILTGYRVDVWRTWAATYKPEDHWTGPVTVGGFVDPNAAADGRELVRRYLVHLAHHPQTAQRLARKLAVKFVRDDPPQALVDRLARTYLEHDTAIVPVLRELVTWNLVLVLRRR